jgi:hypothetical protein
VQAEVGAVLPDPLRQRGADPLALPVGCHDDIDEADAVVGLRPGTHRHRPADGLARVRRQPAPEPRAIRQVAHPDRHPLDRDEAVRLVRSPDRRGCREVADVRVAHREGPHGRAR